MRKTLALLTLAALCGCVLDKDLKHRGPTAPETLNDGWNIDAPENVGLDPAALDRIHQELLRPDRYLSMLAFLVIKDGKLVFEAYLRDPSDRDSLHHLMSVTKSVTSLVVGRGRDEGWMPDLGTTFCSVFAEKCGGLDARKHSINLEDLLTMRSGLDFSNDTYSVEMLVDAPADPIRYILDKPSRTPPGQEFEYRDANPQLISYAIARLSGESEESVAKRALFEPLQISTYHWTKGPQGETLGPFGLYLRPRDLAKLGQVMLDGGVWQGRRIVSQDWRDASVASRTPSDNPRFGYGFYWWTVPEAQGYSGWGHGGQFVFVIPSQRLVLVQISLPDTDVSLMRGGTLDEFVDLTRPLW